MNKQEKQKKSNTKIWIICGVLLFIVLYVYIYVVPRVSDIFVDTYVAEYGTLEAGVDAECLFVRDETVYKAQSQGKVERVISQGKLMRKGSKIVTLAGTGYYNESGGIVSYYCDGMETELTTENIAAISEEALQKTHAEDFKVSKCAKNSVSAGDSIFKIVDNKEWCLCAWLTKEEAEGFSEGASVTVDFKDDVRLKMKLVSISEEGEKLKLVLSCNRYYEFFDQYRSKECKLIRSSRNGILLERESIVELDGVSGVYVKDKYGSYNFTPVSILAQDETMAAVEKNYFYDEDGNTVSTVNNYQEILKKPDKSVKESENDVD